MYFYKAAQTKPILVFCSLKSKMIEVYGNNVAFVVLVKRILLISTIQRSTLILFAYSSFEVVGRHILGLYIYV